MTLFVKLRNVPGLSWHVVGKGGHTRCGHPFLAPSPSTVDLPLEEKSCESCLRLIEHDVEKGLLEDASRDRRIVSEWDATLPPVESNA